MQTASVYNEMDGTLNVFIVNYDNEDDSLLGMDFRSFSNIQMIEHVIMDSDLDAVNSFSEPNKVAPRNLKIQNVTNGMVDVVIPKSSWHMLRFITVTQG